MKYDTIRLNASLVDSPGYTALRVNYGLMINGSEFHPEHQLDLISLVKSCQWSGELNIFTCGCGAPGCAGIFQGIEVGHTHDAITWKCPSPLSVSEDTPDLWEHGVTTFENFSFEPDQYIEAIDVCVKRIKSLAISAPRPVEFPVLETELEQVLALETRPFSTQTLEPERRILARQIVVDAYHGCVIVDGAGYEIGDLNLTRELIQQYSAWSALCVFPNDASEVGPYLAYLQAGRLFCRALREYIGRSTAVKFKYHPPNVYNSEAWEVIEIIR